MPELQLPLTLEVLSKADLGFSESVSEMNPGLSEPDADPPDDLTYVDDEVVPEDMSCSEGKKTIARSLASEDYRLLLFSLRFVINSSRLLSFASAHVCELKY